MKHTSVTASGLKYVEICPGFENDTEGLQEAADEGLSLIHI